MSVLLSIFTSGGFGAILGLVGSWLTKKEERKSLELKYKQDLLLADKRKEEMLLENQHELLVADKQFDRAKMESTMKIEEKDIDAFTESQKTSGSFKLVESLRTLTRVFIVTYLLGVTTYFAYNISCVIGGFAAIPIIELTAIYKNILIELVFLTNLSVSWWFGSRASSKVKK